MSVGPKGSPGAAANAAVASPGAGAEKRKMRGPNSVKGIHSGPSLQTQLELNDIPEFASEPGPGHYFGPGSQGFSALGEQRMAKAPSAPELSFPRTGWDEWSKVLISKGHSNSPAFLGKTSTGHEYSPPDTLNTKSMKMGTSQRPDLGVSLGIDPHGSPGPAYNLRDVPGLALGEGGALGNGSFEPKPSKGRLNKSQGLAPRFDKVRGGSIGPGHYPRKDTALNTATGRSIGAGRSAWEKVITPGWECEGRCRASPGPGPPLWRDIKHDGSRSFSMGMAERFPRSTYESCSPGPAAYSQNERGVGKPGKQHLSDTRTPGQVSFGKEPKKPRFRMLLAQKTDKHGGWGYF